MLQACDNQIQHLFRQNREVDDLSNILENLIYYRKIRESN